MNVSEIIENERRKEEKLFPLNLNKKIKNKHSLIKLVIRKIICELLEFLLLLRRLMKIT